MSIRQRMGAVGHSLGAKETLYLAAFDERVKATVSSEGGIGTKFSNWDAAWYLGPCDQGAGIHARAPRAAGPGRPAAVPAGRRRIGRRRSRLAVHRRGPAASMSSTASPPASANSTTARDTPCRRSAGADRRVAADVSVGSAGPTEPGIASAASTPERRPRRHNLPLAHPPHEKDHVLRRPEEQGRQADEDHDRPVERRFGQLEHGDEQRPAVSGSPPRRANLRGPHRQALAHQPGEPRPDREQAETQ